MKIIVFGHKHLRSEEGGIEVVVTELAKRLSKNNEITVLDRKDNKTKYPYDVGNIHVVGIPTFKNTKLNAFVYSFLATLYCLFHKADVVHVHAEGLCGFLPLLKFFRPRLPVVVTIHGLDWQRAKWGGFATKYLKFGERQAAKHADAIIVLNHQTEEYFLENYGRVAAFIPNGVEAHITDRTDLIEPYGLSTGSYILYIGRLATEKRVELLIRAFRHSVTTRKLVVAGPIKDHPEIVAEAKWNPDIIFINNAYGDLKAQLLSNAALFVLPSDIEGMSVALLEALSYGIPTLVSDIDANTSVVHRNEFLHTFKAGDEDDLKNKIGLMTAVPFYRDSDQIAWIAQTYSWEECARKTEKALKEATKACRGGSNG